VAVDVSWQKKKQENQRTSEFRKKFQGKVPYALYDNSHVVPTVASVPHINSICPAVSIEHRLVTDRQTLGNDINTARIKRPLFSAPAKFRRQDAQHLRPHSYAATSHAVGRHDSRAWNDIAVRERSDNGLRRTETLVGTITDAHVPLYSLHKAVCGLTVNAVVQCSHQTAERGF